MWCNGKCNATSCTFRFLRGGNAEKYTQINSKLEHKKKKKATVQNNQD